MTIHVRVSSRTQNKAERPKERKTKKYHKIPLMRRDAAGMKAKPQNPKTKIEKPRKNPQEITDHGRKSCAKLLQMSP